jgi:hypothetical protein
MWRRCTRQSPSFESSLIAASAAFAKLRHSLPAGIPPLPRYSLMSRHSASFAFAFHSRRVLYTTRRFEMASSAAGAVPFCRGIEMSAWSLLALRRALLGWRSRALETCPPARPPSAQAPRWAKHGDFHAPLPVDPYTVERASWATDCHTDPLAVSPHKLSYLVSDHQVVSTSAAMLIGRTRTDSAETATPCAKSVVLSTIFPV